jgi:putative membrane protein
MRSERSRFILHCSLLGAATIVLVWSYIGAYDRMTWWLESIPAIVAAVVLVATYRRFPLTDLAYILIAIHAVILMVGGHYTYARVPLGEWARDAFDLSRNHYDRLGHFAQGFVPAIISREVLLRTSPLRRGKWLFFLVVCVCLAISAAYELIEWLSVIIGGEQSGDFLGTQGDVWDAQKDMTFALIGAILAQLLLGWLHDRQLRKVAPEVNSLSS